MRTDSIPAHVAGTDLLLCQPRSRGGCRPGARQRIRADLITTRCSLPVSGSPPLSDQESAHDKLKNLYQEVLGTLTITLFIMSQEVITVIKPHCRCKIPGWQMRPFALLAASLGAAVQGNLEFPPGCATSSKANYWANNPVEGAPCYEEATVYCPDSLADNYNADSGKLRPRYAYPPPYPTLCPHLPVAPKRTNWCALVGACKHHQTSGDPASPSLRLTDRASNPPPPPLLPPRTDPPYREEHCRSSSQSRVSSLAWQLPKPPRWPSWPIAPTTSTVAPIRRLPTTSPLCRRPTAISGP